tara:strand:- start:912 stop:2537 length:1626 start_codon:yes stop_codon:yes gene_type:complete
MKKKVLITSALPYINNIPHMGHMVGCHLPADIFARYCRQKGYDVTFVGGSDEHGTPSVIAAGKEDKNIKDFVDNLHEIHKKIYERMNISYDIYSRTSDEEHFDMTQEIFLDIYNSGYVVEKEEELYYSEEDKMFLPDRFLIGECPSCRSEANSDQCESCGKVLSSKELVNPKSILSGSTPVLRKSTHLYLDLAKISSKLDEWLESKRDIFKKNVYSEAKKWIKEGLRARSITRDMSWGVPVPLDGYEGKVFYVWFDAPIGYMTFAKKLGVNWEDREIFHFLGKDNIPFHTVFWPSILIAANRKLPYNVVGYNYLTFEGEKFSKSKSIGVFCTNIHDESLDIDMLRFYLASCLPESKDSDFRWKEFRQVVNSQLIGNVANFFNRTVSMINKYFDGEISLSEMPSYPILSEKKIFSNDIGILFEKGEIRAGIKKILEFSSLGNSFIDSKEPWNLAKTDKKELSKVLYSCLDHARTLAILMSPIVPDKMATFWKDQLLLTDVPSKPGLWNLEENFPLIHKIGRPNPLYKRVDEEELTRIINILS